jgi:hypothetical protein
MPSTRALLIELTIVAGLGLFLALLGPFGSFEAPLAGRLLYWLGLGLGGYLLFRPAMTAASAVARRLDRPEAATWTAGCLLAAVPMSLPVWFVSPGRPGGWPDGAEWLAVYANVAVVGGAVTLVFWILSAGERRALVAASPAPAPAAPPSEESEPTATPRFLDRLPPHLGRDLFALEMEDHYVRAHTAAGSALILMRMRDAVAELDGLDGLQVHRSWWVARAAVQSVLQDGRNMRLTLRNGIEAPVARDRQAAVRDAGWL